MTRCWEDPTPNPIPALSPLMGRISRHSLLSEVLSWAQTYRTSVSRWGAFCAPTNPREEARQALVYMPRRTVSRRPPPPGSKGLWAGSFYSEDSGHCWARSGKQRWEVPG